MKKYVFLHIHYVNGNGAKWCWIKMKFQYQIFLPLLIKIQSHSQYAIFLIQDNNQITHFFCATCRFDLNSNHLI